MLMESPSRGKTGCSRFLPSFSVQGALGGVHAHSIDRWADGQWEPWPFSAKVFCSMAPFVACRIAELRVYFCPRSSLGYPLPPSYRLIPLWLARVFSTVAILFIKTDKNAWPCQPTNSQYIGRQQPANARRRTLRVYDFGSANLPVHHTFIRRSWHSQVPYLPFISEDAMRAGIAYQNDVLDLRRTFFQSVLLRFFTPRLIGIPASATFYCLHSATSGSPPVSLLALLQ
ncbi:hypothetical protein B0H10DRAFT_2015830 [Mycena sp. CBHHK59/15]|nr:hypothetical protein B0H10DRAFT_2015830 [Mycena sp. CBHHK59/15]